MRNCSRALVDKSAAARADFELSRTPTGSRTTKREQLNQVWKTTGQIPEELAAVPPFPGPVAYLWQWWMDLQTSQDHIVTFQEILAWRELTGRAPTPEEVYFIRDLSRLFIKTLSKQ